jgi:antagonist of KipI
MSIKIIKPGMEATLQDGGRMGFRNIGIGTGGAMDSFALQVSNFLVGNEASAAVMEINFPAPEILFQQDALISITGADLMALINEIPVKRWAPLLVKKDAVLRFSKPVSGARSYLAVKNGWQAQQWLGSYSTHLKVGAGGHLGRAVQKEDCISFENLNFTFAGNKMFNWQVSQFEQDKMYQPGNIIRCIKSIEWEVLDQASKENFEKELFLISGQSDRMGYRLIAKPLTMQQPVELISSAVDAGIIQLLPDGNSIILMADHQTTGGYPRIASILKADLPRLAQMKPGQSIKFMIVSLQQAETAFMAMQQLLKEIRSSCKLYLNKYFTN